MKCRAFQVVDLGFGDSGKGTLVDYLTAKYGADLVVRFNGGPQAGHNVVLADGRHHTFAQFGSGMFMAGVRTLLSRFMLIEPYAMLNEARHLAGVGVEDALSRTFIDGRCAVITPPQQIANRVRERARGPGRHGTCGMGVGECVGDTLSHPALTLRAAELGDRSSVRRKLTGILEYKRRSLETVLAYGTDQELQIFKDPSWIDVAVELYREVGEAATIVSPVEAAKIIESSECLVMEGAQGVLLDERFGFQPNTTWSCTTYQNADAVLDESASE
jgi:adenylosuccinate synthase